MKNILSNITLFCLLFAVATLSGCAKACNTMDRDGGIIGSYAGDWVVVNYSGGRIMDVWKLENVMVQSEAQSDGWLFKDSAGNVINIGGDAKAIRFKSKTGDWEKYHEYHAEFESVTYESKYFAAKIVEGIKKN